MPTRCGRVGRFAGVGNISEHTFAEAAVVVLDQAGEALHYTVITERALAASLVKTTGKTPWETLNARICVDLASRGSQSPFVRVSPGVFGLRRWVEEGRISLPPRAPPSHVRVPHFPLYSTVRAVLPVWAGVPASRLMAMQRAIDANTGSRAVQEDWTDPDAWITERLEGLLRELATATWSKAKLNPRYTTGPWLLISGYELLVEGTDGVLTLTPRGLDFVGNVDGPAIREVDDGEGVLRLLAMIADASPTTPADLLAPWLAYLHAETRIQSDAYARSTLQRRLANLHERALIERVGRTCSITESGLRWLGTGAPFEVAASATDEQEIREIAERQRKRVREEMLEILGEMEPYAFEHLVRTLLEEMGYENARVTAPSNDKGVDVVASIQLGISEVREVVQVKRQRGNIHRPVLDALRGSLHRFQAVRGTIITTGDFAKGTVSAAFELGAPPITLINGNRLVDLLFEHQIGARRREVVVWELDRAAFAASADDEKG